MLSHVPFLRRFAADEANTQSNVHNAGLWALKDVSFSVDPGEVIGIIGPNGAGKSTLLKIIARVTAPTAGQVVGRGQVASLLELGLGFQSELTARENIDLYASLYGIPRKVLKDRFDKIVQFAELGEAIDNPLRTYSSGMYLRLAFSVAANLEPDILLADEVLAVGDIGFQERCIQRVAELKDEGRTVLFVSHDMVAIRRMCSRTAWLHKGQLRMIGDTDEVVSAYEEFMFVGDGGERDPSRGVLSENKDIALVSACLASAEGDEMGALKLGQDAYFEFSVTTKRKKLDIYVGFDVYANLGKKQHVFRGIQPSFHAPVKGNYKVTVRVPAGSFTDMHYSVNASAVAISDGVHKAVVAPSAFGFRAYHLTPVVVMSPFGTGEIRVKGLFTPDLVWSIAEREASSAKRPPARASAK